MVEIFVPSPGESITEVEISHWLVSNGDYVEKDQEIAEIESDKATLPLLASEGGIIEIVAQAGELVKVGALACKIEAGAKGANLSDKQLKGQGQNDLAEKQAILKVTSNTGNVNVKAGHSIKVTPLAKKLMHENQLDVDSILKGLKRLGVNEIKQVLNEGGGINKMEAGPGTERTMERKKMSQLRKKLGERLVSVKNETAMLTTFNEVDMTEILRLRLKYQEGFSAKHGVKLGFMSFFTKAVTIALECFPAVNSQMDGDEIVFPSYADIGIAVQTPKGLMVPVVRDAHLMGLAQLEIEIKRLADKGRDGKISIDDLTGGTFTITNGGVFGSLLSTPILNPPQSGILGMHSIQERPVAVNGKVEIRPMMYIALSYDHRTIDGKDSVGFLVKMKELLEMPYKMLNRSKNPDELLLGL